MRGLLQFFQVLLDVAVGLPSSNRFDTPDAGRGAAFADDDEGADLAGLVHVRAAAQFIGEWVRVTDLDSAHVIAILLPEKRRGAFLLCFGEFLFRNGQRVIIQNTLVDAFFDCRQLFGGKAFLVGEVETQAIRRDQ